MGGEKAGPDRPADDRERSARTSMRLAMAIALLPIPISLLIAWALGNPPWRPRADPGDRPAGPAHHGHP